MIVLCILIFYIYQSHICDMARIGHPHSNLHVPQCEETRCEHYNSRYWNACHSRCSIKSGQWRL